MRRHLLLVPLFAVLSANVACGTSRMFAPRENQNGAGPTGRPAAVYGLSAPAQGEVRLWSEGGEQDQHQGVTTTVLHIGFEIENAGTEPISLDTASVRIANVTTDQGVAAGEPVLQGAAARVEALPGTTARADLEFAVPGEVAPRVITGFHVHWRVEAGAASHAQVTPFQTFYPDYDDRWNAWPWWGVGFGWRHTRCR